MLSTVSEVLFIVYRTSVKNVVHQQVQTLKTGSHVSVTVAVSEVIHSVSHSLFFTVIIKAIP